MGDMLDCAVEVGWGVSSASKGVRRTPIPHPVGGHAMKSSRREFLKTAGAMAAASVLPSRVVCGRIGAGPQPLQQFGYGDVELLEGPLRHQFDTNHCLLSAPWTKTRCSSRSASGRACPRPGEDMGGWYSWAPLSDLDKPGNNGFCAGRTALGNIFRGWRATTRRRATRRRRRRCIGW